MESKITKEEINQSQYVITERKLRKILSRFLEECENGKLQRTGTSIEGKVIEWMNEKDLMQSISESQQSQPQQSSLSDDEMWDKLTENVDWKDMNGLLYYKENLLKGFKAALTNRQQGWIHEDKEAFDDMSKEDIWRKWQSDKKILTYYMHAMAHYGVTQFADVKTVAELEMDNRKTQKRRIAL